jgi:hypothetical protein
MVVVPAAEGVDVSDRTVAVLAQVPQVRERRRERDALV